MKNLLIHLALFCSHKIELLIVYYNGDHTLFCVNFLSLGFQCNILITW